jgi:hypothetical protein
MIRHIECKIASHDAGADDPNVTLNSFHYPDSLFSSFENSLNAQMIVVGKRPVFKVLFHGSGALLLAFDRLTAERFRYNQFKAENYSDNRPAVIDGPSVAR